MAEKIGSAIGVVFFVLILVSIDWGIQIKPLLEALGF